jgi:hypothetical protein
MVKVKTCARFLAYVTGLVKQELLLQNQYVAPESRILRSHLPLRIATVRSGTGNAGRDRQKAGPQGSGRG